MGRGERGNEVEDKIKQPGAFFFWFLREQRGPAGGGAGGGVPRQGNCPGSRSSFFFSSRRRHWRFKCDWSSDVCSSDLIFQHQEYLEHRRDLFLGEAVPGWLEGSAHCIADRGYLFLHNGTESVKAAQIAIDQRLGLDSGS